jgi:hypothetical protein
MVDFNFQIFTMLKRTPFNYFSSGSGYGSSTPHAKLIDIKKIKKRFQEMKPHHMQLSQKVTVCSILF